MMNEVYINATCPNCGQSFKPDMSFGNLHRCVACKQWSFFINGYVDENVIYKIIPFQQDKESFRQEFTNKIVESYNINEYLKLGEALIKTFYLPVREIKTGPKRELIPANKDYESLHTLLFKRNIVGDTIGCADYDMIIPIELQQDFSEKLIQNNSLEILDIDIEKESQDIKFQLSQYDVYKIIYLPVYEISFSNNDKKWYCLGLKSFPGLNKSITLRKSSNDLIHPILATVIIIFGGLKGCSNISHPIDLIISPILGMLKGCLVCLAIIAIRLIWVKRNRKELINKVLQTIHFNTH